MNTRYGVEVNNTAFNEYIDVVVGKIFKLLPLREEKNMTLDKYHSSLMADVLGNKTLFELEQEKDMICLLVSLEGLITIHDMELYRGKVFECINLAKKLKK